MTRPRIDNQYASERWFPHVLTRKTFSVLIIPRRGSEEWRQMQLQARREKDRARRAQRKLEAASRAAAEAYADPYFNNNATAAST